MYNDNSTVGSRSLTIPSNPGSRDESQGISHVAIFLMTSDLLMKSKRKEEMMEEFPSSLPIHLLPVEPAFPVLLHPYPDFLSLMHLATVFLD